MKFSIRFLLLLTLMTALLASAILQQREAIRLRSELERRKLEYARLEKTISWMNPRHTHKQIKLCEQVLPDAGISSEIFVAAKQRFERLQQDGSER